MSHNVDGNVAVNEPLVVDSGNVEHNGGLSDDLLQRLLRNVLIKNVQVCVASQIFQSLFVSGNACRRNFTR